MPVTPVLAAVTSRDLGALKKALSSEPADVTARVMVDAARLGWTAGLTALTGAGGDLNASYKNYRPIHALLQEKPHAGGSSTPERVACLEWMLAHGANPEPGGAWAARASTSSPRRPSAMRRESPRCWLAIDPWPPRAMPVC